MPNNWSLPLVGLTNHVMNVIEKLVTGMSTIYILDSPIAELDGLKKLLKEKEYASIGRFI